MYWSNLSAAANAAAAYQTGQTGYAVSHTPAAGTYTTQRAPSTFDASYQTATSHASASFPTPSTTYDYGYTAARAPAQQTAAAAAAAAVYDTSKTYYTQPAAAVAAATAAAAVATPYTAAEAHYQGGTLRQSTSTAATPKTSYAAGYSVSSASQAVYNTTAYTQQSSTANKGSGPYMQQSVQSSGVKNAGGTWQTMKKGPVGGSGSGGPNRGHMKPKARAQQLHYCDVCKISCAGPQTYREHLEGQKHKKKEAAAKAGPVPSRLGASLRCELCDVTCTGADAYAAHIRGAKHQKVVKLHQKLGKPIPSADPIVVGAKGGSPGASTSGVTGASSSSTPGKVGVSSSSPTAVKKESSASSSDLKDDLLDLKEKEVEPVGQEYIEEIKGSEGDAQGKVVSFNCKLCECRFNDPNAKEMHMKGRRHRLQYKKKVNPDLQVEVKHSMRQRKIYEEKLRRQQLREEVWRRREEERAYYEEEERWRWEEWRRVEEEEMAYSDWYRGGRYPRGPHPPPPHHPRMPFMPQMHPLMMRRPDSSDDRHVMGKHADIYPHEDELASIQKIVSNTEKALKLVSDYLADLDAPKDVKVKEEKKETAAATAAATPTTAKDTQTTAASTKDKKDSSNEKKDDSPCRMLKGVMRVGILAKGLLLRGDTSVQLVVLCGEKPTRTLLDRVADALPQHLSTVAPNEKYEVQRVVEDAAIQVTHDTHTVTVTLTAPLMREQLLHADAAESQVGATKDAPDVLDKQKCLDALASLRHAKWFQARVTGLQSCVMVIRIMRDLCQRVPTWRVLNSWALELICEKVIASAGQPMSPGDGIRRVFEAVASGLLLPGSPGLMDTCEKDPIDAAAHLTSQEREDLTASAQHALRLIAFRQIHAVLGMEAIPPPKFARNGRFNRKRRRDNSTGEGGDSENEQDGGDGKKGKKEEEEDDGEMETEKTK